ncbi:MAG: DUF971 domain-containing protein [Calditrichaeota bacterium]|nr:DUF971 domain-containing protein [Calditrichota bacterium]
MFPNKIQLLSDKVIFIIWNDEHESIFFANHLRINCPCASCEKIRNGGESSEAYRQLKESAESVAFKSWRMVGRYAVGFAFSDGHNLGMYRFEELRRLCQCEQCRTDVIRIRGPLK